MQCYLKLTIFYPGKYRSSLVLSSHLLTAAMVSMHYPGKLLLITSVVIAFTNWCNVISTHYPGKYCLSLVLPSHLQCYLNALSWQVLLITSVVIAFAMLSQCVILASNCLSLVSSSHLLTGAMESMHYWERSGSVVECLTRDRGASGSSLTGISALCP